MNDALFTTNYDILDKTAPQDRVDIRRRVIEEIDKGLELTALLYEKGGSYFWPLVKRMADQGLITIGDNQSDEWVKVTEKGWAFAAMKGDLIEEWSPDGGATWSAGMPLPWFSQLSWRWRDTVTNETQAAGSPEWFERRPREDSMQALAAEIVRARTKFPGNRFLYTALAEEFGELAKAILQKEGRERIMEEALQVACVAMRLYEEGDPAYDSLTDEEAKA